MVPQRHNEPDDYQLKDQLKVTKFGDNKFSKQYQRLGRKIIIWTGSVGTPPTFLPSFLTPLSTSTSPCLPDRPTQVSKNVCRGPFF